MPTTKIEMTLAELAKLAEEKLYSDGVLTRGKKYFVGYKTSMIYEDGKGRLENFKIVFVEEK